MTMISDYRCFFCFTKSYENLLHRLEIPVDTKNTITCEMAKLYTQQFEEFHAPTYSRALREMLYTHIGKQDMYIQQKKDSNALALSLYNTYKQQVLHSDTPFDTAVRLAVAGNIVDFGISHSFDLELTIQHVLQTPFALDCVKELHDDIAKAQTVLYLGDNSGEIVFDKILIETMMHNTVFFAVRGAPVLNDVTIDDAMFVGMDTVSDVISNGYDAPSTVLEYASDEFKEIFNKADVIISKGQGNLEGLYSLEQKNIYFLLMVKCDVVAELLGVKKGDFVVTKHN